MSFFFSWLTASREKGKKRTSDSLTVKRSYTVKFPKDIRNLDESYKNMIRELSKR